ncbi:hypothetical protein BKA70DRAFT_1418309 [Coprinopsis sp. MPI-PUGE-AT-0042]|nr:hypothetical protein BKA70DRAFT_1418309 [Coprinopsis sp. MPI-PUGE-AT-0042]
MTQTTSLVGFVARSTARQPRDEEIDQYEHTPHPPSFLSIICQPPTKIHPQTPAAPGADVTTTISQQPGPTTNGLVAAQPSPADPPFHVEIWKFISAPPKGSIPHLSLNMDVFMEDDTKEPNQTITRRRKGTLERVVKREKNWLQYLVRLEWATDQMGENGPTTELGIDRIRLLLAVPRRYTAFSIQESIYFLAHWHSMDDGPFWESPRRVGNPDRGNPQVGSGHAGHAQPMHDIAFITSTPDES